MATEETAQRGRSSCFPDALSIMQPDGLRIKNTRQPRTEANFIRRGSTFY